MVGSASPGEPARPDAERRTHDPVHDMSRHVLARIGLEIAMEDGPPRFDLHLEPVLLDGDGHIDFGVLGVYLDMASGQAAAATSRPWVHADITAHRLERPRGRVLRSRSTTLRMGRRSAVIELDVHDELGTHVARSVQEVVFTGPVGEPEERAEMRARFYEAFDGRCDLDAPVREVLGIGRDRSSGDSAWTMALSDAGRNGFGGLHGGAAIALVEAAATGIVGDGGPAVCESAAVRYVAPGLVGPFRAAPTIVTRRDAGALVRVAVHDGGTDDRLIILAEAHVAATR